MRLYTGGIAVAALLSFGGVRPDVAPVDAPAGMVAFFTSGACPAGWQPAELAAGRIVVGVVDPIAVGHTIGAPLGPAEDRAHGHAIAATVALPAKNIAAADGGNNNGAASGDRALVGSAQPASSGLPFAQLTACVR